MGKVLLIAGVVLILGGIGGGYYGYSEYWKYAAEAASDANKAKDKLQAAKRHDRQYYKNMVDDAEQSAATQKKEAYTMWGGAFAGLVIGVVLTIVGRKKMAQASAD